PVAAPPRDEGADEGKTAAAVETGAGGHPECRVRARTEEREAVLLAREGRANPAFGLFEEVFVCAENPGVPVGVRDPRGAEGEARVKTFLAAREIGPRQAGHGGEIVVEIGVEKLGYGRGQGRTAAGSGTRSLGIRRRSHSLHRRN